MRLFGRKKDTKPVQQEEPEHWSVQVFRSLYELAESSPEKFYISFERSSSTYAVSVVDKPELLFNLDTHCDDVCILSPERVHPGPNNEDINRKLAEKLGQILLQDNRHKLGQFMSEYLQGYKFTLLPQRERKTEELHLALQRCSNDFLEGEEYIWFRNAEDATMVKLSLPNKE